jgi:hypothetical protein
MANTCEGDSVEVQQIKAQQIEVTEQAATEPDLTDVKALAARHKAEQARKVQALQLTRARIREQLARSSHERYTVLLNTELQQIEAELAKLA